MPTPRKRTVKRKVRSPESPIVAPVVEVTKEEKATPVIPFYKIELPADYKPGSGVKLQVSETRNVEDKVSEPVVNMKYAAMVLLLVVASAGFWLFQKNNSVTETNVEIPKQDTKVFVDKMVIPETKSVAAVDGRLSASQGSAVPINAAAPEQVAVATAKLTLKGGYDVAVQVAQKWSSDAKLVFIKSLGTLLVDGRSSEWQVVFGSGEKKAGYEVLVWEDKVVKSKEVPAESFGFELPQKWYDSGNAISSLQTMPQFASSTISGISFYFNMDSTEWEYGLSTSNGNTSMRVR